MQNVMRIRSFDINAINYSNDAKPKRLDSGASQLYLNYGPDNDPIIIQTPEFTLPFNMSSFDTGKYTKYSIEGSFRGKDNYPSLNEFYDKFKSLDDKFINDGVTHSLKWLKKKKITREIIEAGMYHPLIKPSTDKMTGEPDGKYPDTIRFKLPFRDDKFMFQVFDLSTHQELNTPLKDLLVKGAKVRLLIQCTGMWIASGRYGVGFKVVQLRVKTPPRLTDYSFLADSDDEEDDTQVDGSDDVDIPEDVPVTSNNVVNDSDDSDDSDESDSEPEPVAPVKIVKKKRGRRKKGN